MIMKIIIIMKCENENDNMYNNNNKIIIIWK